MRRRTMAIWITPEGDQEAPRETRWNPQQTEEKGSQSSSIEYPAH